MIVFVILHYLTLKNTISEVEHILNDLSGNKKIVVVDNGSPNESGRILKEKYQENELVKVIINSENIGFARGMNVGYLQAQKYKPDFIALLNNDIEFTQNKFIDLVKQSYRTEPFAVLGPEVIVPEMNQHQNPKKNTSYSITEVRAIHDRNQKIMKLPRPIFRLRAIIKKFNFLRKFASVIRKNKNGEEKRILTNVVLHGSIMIFSKDFMNSFEIPFVPDTFFYFETEILDRLIRQKKLISKYDPTIKVLHHKSSSTRESFSGDVQRLSFQVGNMVKSTEVFLDMFGGENKHGL